MESFEHRFLQFVETNKLFSKKDKLLVGISGGPDSVCLAFLLFRLGFQFHLAHVNYHLRGNESDDDEFFCKTLASQFQCHIHILNAPIPKTNIQETARKIRYNWFFHLKEQFHYDFILTAHHWDDQIETMLYYFTRGAYYHIFHPIPLKTRTGLRRPLLFATKQEILNYLNTHKVPYRIDSSNLSRNYLRNQIRHDWIPLIQQLNPAYQSHFQHQLQIYEEQLHLLQQCLTPYQKQWIQVQLDHTIKIMLPPPNALLQWKHVLYLYFSPYYSTYDLQPVFELYNADTGKKVKLRHHIFFKERTYILAYSQENVSFFSSEPYTLPLSSLSFPYVFEWNQTQFSLQLLPASHEVNFSLPDQCYMDFKKIDSYLRFRLWKAGDRMVKPLGLKGSKLVSDILNEMKVPASQKSRYWLIEDCQGILYVQGYRICERVKITPESTSILKISWKPLAGTSSNLT